MEEFIRNENLRRFRERLAVEKDPALRRLLQSLIVEFDRETFSPGAREGEKASRPRASA
ncbi:MAG TPA: hypothetical protein VGH03_06985 [Caulobacteraceae bacterium]|jgi:hypothetical protein